MAVTSAPVSDTATMGPRAHPRAESYARIFSSTALIGGASVLTIGVSIVRAKIVAVLLGPAGVGLMGLYVSVLELAQSVAGMGINSSGVRQIAAASGTGDDDLVARTAEVLRRTALILGLVGAAVTASLSGLIASATFGRPEFAPAIALLSLAVLCRAVSDGQTALLQGLRRIGDMARMSVATSLCSAGATVTLIYLFGHEGVVPALIVAASITLAANWWFQRRITIARSRVPLSALIREVRPLLALGFAFMASAMLTTGAAYVIRVLVRRELGVETAGLYQAAWAIGGIYVGFILQAMGSDFYPRLTAVVADREEANRLVNEQAQVGLLLAGPGVIATLTFAPLVLAVLYHETFAGAAAALRWICLGMALRVVAWPMGFIVLAKGARGTFLWTEIAAAAVHIGLAWLLVPRFGLAGAAAAFFGLYVWHSIVVYAIVRRLTGFHWSPANWRTGTLFFAAVAVVFVSVACLPVVSATCVGSGATVVSVLYAWRAGPVLLNLADRPRFVAPWRVVAALRHGVTTRQQLPRSVP